MKTPVLAKIDGIRLNGFSRPVSVRKLRETRCSAVPQAPGTYLILRTSSQLPKFLSKSTGGWFKGKDPSCLLEMVRANWVTGAYIVYVGKAAGQKGLNRRLNDLVDFGFGRAVGHRGGRLLWHLPESNKLVVRWRTCSAGEADRAETAAIASFKAVYDGKRPYANLTK